ncbi:MAG: class I SAM-dependent methyltransferase [Acidimicrobiales bacterium]|nr:class I SAM-dependent methyltransferase [Acidimicrobiales bacterium]
MGEELFERADEYDAMLAEGLSLSGEDKGWFIEGRLRWLSGRLPTEARPRRILDFACGVGDTAAALARTFPGAEVVGFDLAEAAVERARERHGAPGITFVSGTDLPAGTFDLCYVNGAFHHIPSAEQPRVLAGLRAVLAPGGWLALFENNPWNPGARLVMRRIPFDRDAVMLSIPRARRLVHEAGFAEVRPTTTGFWFPRALAPLRPTERALSRLPGGAQYLVLARA